MQLPYKAWFCPISWNTLQWSSYVLSGCEQNIIFLTFSLVSLFLKMSYCVEKKIVNYIEPYNSSRNERIFKKFKFKFQIFKLSTQTASCYLNCFRSYLTLNEIPLFEGFMIWFSCQVIFSFKQLWLVCFLMN